MMRHVCAGERRRRHMCRREETCVQERRLGDICAGKMRRRHVCRREEEETCVCRREEEETCMQERGGGDM